MIGKKEIVCYNTDASRLIGKTDKVYHPLSLDEVQDIIKNSNYDIVPRGYGKSLVGGCVPNNSIVVDVSKMNKVTNFNPNKRTVRAEAGITIKELNEKLNSLGYEFPIYSSDSGITTVGGMIALNSSGDRSMKYGTIKEWLEEVEFINGAGYLIKTSKADLQEVAGLEGITGIIAAATIKLLPLFNRTASIFQSEDLPQVMNVARRLRNEKEVTMIRLFSPIVSSILGFPKKYNILVEFDSNRGKIQGDEYNKLMKLKDRVYFKLYSREYFNSEDPKLYFDNISEFILFLDKYNIPYFGDLGTGIIYAFFKDDDKNKWDETLALIRKTKVKFGRYGVGITRKNLLDSFEMKLIKRIKSRHDPQNKMNKNKLIDVGSLGLSETIKKYQDESLQLKEKREEIKQRQEFIEVKPDERISSGPIVEDIHKNVNDTNKEVIKEDTKKTERKDTAPVDYKSIQSIMTNRGNPNNNSNNVNKSSISNNNQSQSYGKITAHDNFDRKIEATQGENKPLQKGTVTESEKDLINKIMGNRFGNSFKIGNDKKSEEKAE